MQQISKFCPRCGRYRLFARPEVNHVLHLLITVLLCGFWLPIWIMLSVRSGGWRCQHCGYGSAGRSLLGYLLLIAAAFLLLFAVLGVLLSI